MCRRAKVFKHQTGKTVAIFVVCLLKVQFYYVVPSRYIFISGEAQVLYGSFCMTFLCRKINYLSKYVITLGGFFFYFATTAKTLKKTWNFFEKESKNRSSVKFIRCTTNFLT
uniref:(northern house mosquito) hypothetical protein n=1 Tax=Culex pipiens TaxID=7175 RepID=A0A8D8FVM0_CULPI